MNDLVRSAFGHAGQKCSAASLAILVGQAGRSKRLHSQIVDGVRSLRVGPPTDPLAKMGPIIAPAEPEGMSVTAAQSMWETVIAT